ncbi:MAG: saccharopine dehydrogenase family protein [Actinomadura sp.]
MTADRTHDIVLFGATGFTGGLTAEYLAEHAPPETRWALAGRNQDKLAALRERLAAINPACADLPLLHADVTEPETLAAVATATRVVITTVGPYIHYGEPLVSACATAGTDYVDLTGEPEFVDLTYVRHHAQAAASGARIVHACGFDSIPHDLGAYFTVRQLPENVPLHIEGFVRARGTASGGTAHSLITALSRGRQTLRAARERRRIEGRPAGRRIRVAKGRARFATAADASWALPLRTIDPAIVTRSAAALDRYGPDFSYGHFGAVKRLATAAGMVAGIGGLLVLAQLPPTRRLLLKVRRPGDGPSAEQRAKSWFTVRFVGEGGGERVVTEVAGGDPGYGETAKMLAESALCLAHDDLPPTAGQVTTAVAMGDALIERLQKAGITFTVRTPAGG